MTKIPIHKDYTQNICFEENHDPEHMKTDALPSLSSLSKSSMYCGFVLFQTGKSLKAFMISFWKPRCLDALCNKFRGVLKWCSIGRQSTIDACVSQFQIFRPKVVVGIHDKNSVTERVSKSVQRLLPVRINTWK